MSRLFVLIAPLAALAACAAPAPQSGPVSAPMSFNVPMDPGTIRCAALDNPAAFDAALDWSLGQLRAEVLAGKRTAAPQTLDLADTVRAACAARPGATIRDVLS